MLKREAHEIREEQPLVSVIIPCYNHARFLSTAIKSVLNQTYPHIEIIVVDDGSADNTRQITESFTSVNYIYQPNAGLSASRNKGIKKSKGQYILFLDADDWLYPEAIAINIQYFTNNPQLAFVSGSYDNADEKGNITNEYKVTVTGNHYCRLLDYNYIGMIATVLFAKWVFNEYLFDTRLRGCEDHDLYLKIARKYPVLHHTEKIAVYRRHNNNMSSNNGMMIHTAFQILLAQKDKLKTVEEKKAYDISYVSLYKQIFWLGKKVPEKDLEIFKKDRKTFYSYRTYTIIKKFIRSFRNG